MGAPSPTDCGPYDCFAGVASGADLAGCVIGSVAGVAFAFSSTWVSGLGTVEVFGSVMGNMSFNITAIFRRYVLNRTDVFILQ